MASWSRIPVRRSWNGSATGQTPWHGTSSSRYWPTIYGFARHRGCSEHTAEEIVQDVMLKVFQQRDVYQYDPARGRFRDWLGTVVRNNVAEHRRRPANRLQGRGRRLETAGRLEPAGRPARMPTPRGKPLSRTACFWRCWTPCAGRRSARTYLAFELVGLEGLSGGEAAR